MKLHKNWNVTDLGLARLRNLSDEDLRKEIANKNLFAGFTTAYAKEQNEKIYGKINNSRVNKKVGKAKPTKTKKGNRKDS